MLQGAHAGWHIEQLNSPPTPAGIQWQGSVFLYAAPAIQHPLLSAALGPLRSSHCPPPQFSLLSTSPLLLAAFFSEWTGSVIGADH